MIPVGILMGLAVGAGAVQFHRLGANDRAVAPRLVVLGAVCTVAVVRAIGSIWLPHVGRGLTRQHQTSIVIATLTALSLIGLVLWQRRQTHSDLVDV